MTRSIKLGLILLMLMLCGGLAQAQSFMTFNATNGWPFSSWSLNDVRKVTFDGGDIVVRTSASDESFALSDVLSIKFTDSDHQDPTTVEKINSDVAQLRIASDETSIRVIGANNGAISICSISGQPLYNNRNWHGEIIDISYLERGIYIITINNSTFKFRK